MSSLSAIRLILIVRYQKTAGAQLTALENKWTNLIEGNTQLEIATLQLEYRVEQMKERERQLREQILAVEQ